MERRKFYEFKNTSDFSSDLYIYGEIVEDDANWWTGEKDPSLVGLTSFKEELDSLGNIRNLNMYINSPGGDVFTASTMVSMLNRLKDKGTVINAYVDGLSASAASFLMMVADNIKLYKNSIVMVHKPMSMAWGNADDLQKTIDALDKIEDGVMMPLYMKKAKVEEKKIKSLVDEESWLDTKDMDKYFNVELLDEEKVAVASVSSNLFKNYKNTPDFVKNLIENDENLNKTEEKTDIPSEEEAPIDKEKVEEVVPENVEEVQEADKEAEIKARLALVNVSLKLKNL